MFEMCSQASMDCLSLKLLSPCHRPLLLLLLHRGTRTVYLVLPGVYLETEGFVPNVTPLVAVSRDSVLLPTRL